MKTKCLWALLAALLATAAYTANGLATLPSGIAVTTFVRATLGADKPNGGVSAHADHVRLSTRGATDVAVQTIISPPDGSSGWHSHPGLGVVAVQSGTVTLYDEHCNTTEYGPGQAFIEAGDDPSLVRNNTTSDAVLYVTFVVPKDAVALRIEHPQPADCAAH